MTFLIWYRAPGWLLRVLPRMVKAWLINVVRKCLYCIIFNEDDESFNKLEDDRQKDYPRDQG